MSSPSKSNDKLKNEDEKEKAKNLVNYAQKHQQTKESHRPGNFYNPPKNSFKCIKLLINTC